MKPKILMAGVLIVALAAFTCPSLAQPMADYGDAPDPTFPSLFASSGPNHAVLNDCYVGWASTAEPNALVPNADLDDGVPVIFAALLNGVWTGWVYIPITIDPAASPLTPRYLNVLLDGNNSGTWCDMGGEWLVRNYQLPKYAGTVHYPGQTVYYCIGGFTWVTSYSGSHWLRATLSDGPVIANTVNGWDGSTPGGFALGETEDWLLTWFYHPPQPPDPPNPPPSDPADPPGPVPLPDCNKSVAVYQVPPPTHRGHSGSFGIGVENTGTHPIHIVAGPFPTDVNGSPINIEVESLESTIIQPGGKVVAPAGWSFPNPPTNQTWCNWDVVVDPAGQYVVGVNVGNYVSSTSTQPTGGSFLEVAVPGFTRVGLIVLILATGFVSLYFIIRRYKLAGQSQKG